MASRSARTRIRNAWVVLLPVAIVVGLVVALSPIDVSLAPERTEPLSDSEIRSVARTGGFIGMPVDRFTALCGPSDPLYDGAPYDYSRSIGESQGSYMPASAHLQATFEDGIVTDATIAID